MGKIRAVDRSVKFLAAAPLLSQIAVRELYAQAASAVGKDPRQNIYTRLGVKTVINCRGTWTYLSGSLEFPEVRQAELEAARHFVNMFDLQHGVGPAARGIDRRRVGHCYIRGSGRDGGGNGCVHRRQRRKISGNFLTLPA